VDNWLVAFVFWASSAVDNLGLTPTNGRFRHFHHKM
jgi:hypothetical protein